MKRSVRLRAGCALGVVGAALAAACSNSTSPQVPTPCPTYKGGSATPAALAGNYSLVSFCQNTLPAFGTAQGFTGTLTMTHGTTADSFQAVINVPGQSPLALAGPYTVSHDTITVTLPAPLGTFTGTYAFAPHTSGDTLFVSGFLPGSPPPPIAIVFAQ